MTKPPRPKRQKYVLPPTTQAAIEVLERERKPVKLDLSTPEMQNITVADLAQGRFEVLSLPGVARELKSIADEEGTTLDVMAVGAIAMIYQHVGQPVPPDIREYLMKQDMPTALRQMFLKPHIN